MANDINEDDLRSMFIPVEELGMDPSQFTVDADYWFNEMYEMYKDSCHFDDSLDPAQSNEAQIPVEKLNSRCFSAIGRVGFYRWYALTQYFDETVHRMDDQKRKYNKHHKDTLCEEFLSDPGENISHAINNDDDLVNILQRNPIIANTQECVDAWDEEHDCLTLEYSRIQDMTTRLSVFLGQGPILTDIFKKDKGALEINTDVIKGKDVVLPFIWANRDKLKLFGELAKKCCDNGANTVVGIFAARQVPTMDGREAARIPREYEPISFSPRISFRF